MTTETAASSRPNWVYRIGEIAVPIATTFGLFAAVLAWGALDLYGDGLTAIGAMDAVEVTFLAVLATLFVAPPVLVANALLRRRLSTRQSWGVLAVLGGLGGLACLAWVLSGPAPALSSWGRAEVVEFLAFGVYVVLGLALALAGPAIGVWLRQRSLPTDRRTMLIAGLVLAVLFAGPYAVGAAIDDGGDSDAFDPETGGDYQDDPAWNESESDPDETNETEENESDDNASDSDTRSGETRLSTLTCNADAASDLPTDDVTTALNASNVSVHHYPDGTFYEDKHVLMLDVETVPGDVIGASAVATNDSAFPTAFAAAGADGGEFHAPVDEVTRIWIDVDGGDGVQRYSLDLCPDATTSEG